MPVDEGGVKISFSVNWTDTLIQKQKYLYFIYFPAFLFMFPLQGVQVCFIGLSTKKFEEYNHYIRTVIVLTLHLCLVGALMSRQ